jgi:hypothetical protein
LSVINVEGIKKLKANFNNQVDDLLRESSYTITNLNSQVPIITENINLDEKEEEIFYFIVNNPNTTTQEVVNAFNGKPGYSRVPVVRIIYQLKKCGKIVIKADKTNRSKHRLSINKEDILASLVLVVKHFKEDIFVLIDKIESLFSNTRNSSGKMRAELRRLIDCLIMLYKCGKDSFSDSYLWYGKVSDNYTHNKKFSIIYSSMHELHTKLYQMLTHINFVKSSNEMVRLIYRSPTDALRPKNLKFIMRSCKNLNADLRLAVEAIINFLWSINRQRLPLMYSEYEQLSSNKLKNWRNVI